DHVVVADAADRGTDPHDAVDRRREANRAAGVGAESAETHARCYRRSGAAARAGREALGVPRIATGPVVGVVGCPAPGELVHVRLADDDRTGAPEAGGDRGVLVGHEVRQDLGAGGGADTARVNVVLEGNRDTGERPQVVPGANQALDRLRRVARL